MKTIKGISIPDDFAKALKADDKVLAIFEGMRSSCQKTYVKWITEAKKPETRQRRIRNLGEKILDYGRRHGSRQRKG